MSTATNRRRVEITPTLAAKIVKLYTKGMSIVKVSEELDVPASAVRRTLAADDSVTIRPRGRYAGSSS